MDITLLVALGSVIVLIILGVILFLKTSTSPKRMCVVYNHNFRWPYGLHYVNIYS